MRNYSSKEKEVLEILDKSNGLKFQSLLGDKINNLRLDINFKDKTVGVTCYTKTFHPSPKEKSELDNLANELYERIYIAVMQINYFEKMGLIGLYKNNKLEDKIILGDETISKCGQVIQIQDKNIRELLLLYVDKVLIVSAGYNEFVKNGFVTSDEKILKNSLLLTKFSVLIALIVGLINIYSTVINSDIKKFNQDFNKMRPKVDSLLNENKKIEKIIMLNKYIENE